MEGKGEKEVNDDRGSPEKVWIKGNEEEEEEKEEEKKEEKEEAEEANLSQKG